MNKKTIGLLNIIIGSLALAGCGGKWEDTNAIIVLSPIKSGSDVTISASCLADNSLFGCQNVKLLSGSAVYESASLLCIDHGNPYLTTLTLKNVTGHGTVTLQCGIKSSNLGFAMPLTIGVDPIRGISITPASTAESMVALTPGQQQQLTIKPPKLSQYSIGSKFTIVESQSYLSFVNNKNSCTINRGQSSCSVTVQANSNITTTVNQTLQVVTSEFPTELVFIKIVPNTPPTPPTPTSKYIFVSQAITAGDFGSLAAADTICNGDVARTTYPTQLGSGTFKALLNGNNATTIGTEYKNLADEVIATATTTNLVAEDTGLTSPIGKTPSGTQDGQYAWTGLARAGTPASDCVNWSTNSNTSSGTAGYVSLNTAAWSVASAGATPCDTANTHLYCVQQ